MLPDSSSPDRAPNAPHPPNTSLGRSESLVLLVLAVGFAAVCLGHSNPAQWLTGAALVLYLPGRAIRRNLTLPEPDALVGFVIDVAMSLSVVVLAGLALNLASADIDRRSLAISLAAVTGYAALVALARSAPATIRLRRVDSRAVARWAVPVLIFAVLATASVWLARDSSDAADSRATTTQLSVQQLSPTRARVQVTNLEGRSMRYRLVASVSGHALLSKTVIVNSTASRSLGFSMAKVRSGARIDIRLTVAHAHSPFREVWLVRP